MNETCGLTNAPIVHGDQVVMVRFKPEVFKYEPQRAPFGRRSQVDWENLIEIRKTKSIASFILACTKWLYTFTSLHGMLVKVWSPSEK